MPMKTAIIGAFVSLSFAAALELVLSNDSDSVVCQRSNDTAFTPALALPSLPKVFETHIEVTDHIRNRTFEAVEYANMEQTAIHRWENGNFSMCKYRHQENRGHVIDGILCNWTDSLPSRCFCSSPFGCVSFIPLTSIFGYLQTYGAASIADGPPIRGISASYWNMSCWSQQNPNNTLIITVAFSQDNYITGTGEQHVPLSISLQAKGDLLDSYSNDVNLQYEITQFKRTIKNKEMFLSPPGIYCPLQRTKRQLPELASVFSLTMETILLDKQIISYTHHHYDSNEKMVVFTAPISKQNPFSMSAHFQSLDHNEGYRIIHDFKSGIQYLIDERQVNCSVTAIPTTAFDVALVDNTHIRLRHASELLSLKPDSFVYVGERKIRDIPCDVWICEKPISSRGEYVTLEVYFTQDSWTMEVDAAYSHEKVVPVGVTTFVAESLPAQNFSNHVRTYFFDYKIGSTDWRLFEISPCLDHINRLFLVLTLKVSYTKLIQHGLSVVEDSIRRMIAELAGVSPLRVTNVFLSTSSTSDEVDVWFVLLEQPNVTGDIYSPLPQILLADAHLSLHDLIDNKEAEIILTLGPRKKMKIAIKQGSLDLTSELLHPKARFQHDIHLIKAGYSAGSMAGLGFSMALLGASVGVFVGYLLWKRGTSVPYFVHD